jgi:hypothetical protein
MAGSSTGVAACDGLAVSLLHVQAGQHGTWGNMAKQALGESFRRRERQAGSYCDTGLA